MSLYSFLQQRDLLDTPNEDAASIASSVTSTDIKSADVRTYFREQLLWYWFNPQTMAGTIQDAIDGGQLPAELQTALGEMWSSLFGQSATILQTNKNLAISQRINLGIDALLSVGVINAEQYNGFYSFGGGLMFPATTAADVQQAKDDHAAQEAAAAAEEARLEAEMELRDEWETAMMDSSAEEAFYNGDKTALITAINAAVAAMSAPRRG